LNEDCQIKPNNPARDRAGICDATLFCNNWENVSKKYAKNTAKYVNFVQPLSYQRAREMSEPCCSRTEKTTLTEILVGMKLNKAIKPHAHFNNLVVY